MKLLATVRVLLLLMVASTAFSQERMLWEQDPDVVSGIRPIRATECELLRFPEEYVGRIIEVSADVYGGDLKQGLHMSVRPYAISGDEKCGRAKLPIVAVLPEYVTPKPEFTLLRNEAWQRFQGAIDAHYDALVTIRGRFDLTSDCDKNVKSSKKRHPASGEYSKCARIVIQSVTDVYIFPRLVL